MNNESQDSMKQNSDNIGKIGSHEPKKSALISQNLNEIADIPESESVPSMSIASSTKSLGERSF